MLTEMLRGSRAVMLRPSVATFEAHERDRLGWALIYIAIGATITALLGVLSFWVHRPFAADQYAAIAAELTEFERAIGIDLPVEEMLFPTDAAAPVLSNVIGTVVGFMVYLSIVFLLGRGLGGTGTYGELAYDLALFWVPISVLSATIDIFSISFFACLTAPLAVLVTLYGFVLTFLSVQAGMNLAPGRALAVILIPALLLLLFACGLFVLAFALVSQVEALNTVLRFVL